MRKVSDILQKKNRPPITVSVDSPVIEALRIMAENDIGSVVVTQHGKYAGIITERDYSRKVILQGKSSSDTKVADIMTTDLQKLSPTDTVERCSELMSAKHVRYLPVFDNENFVGIISMTDVVQATLHNQREMIMHLQSYLNS
jgi:CBS domain-containing protein